MFKTSAGRAVPQRAASEETRRQILDTALTLFRERGFEATTIRDIAGRAGLSLGAAYYYFKSKEDDRRRLLRLRAGRASSRARARRSPTSRDLRDRLRAALHTKIDIMQDDQRLLRALFRYGGDPDHALSWFGPATREQRALSIGVFAEAIARRAVSRRCARGGADAAVDAAHGRPALFPLRRLAIPAPHAQTDRCGRRLRRRRQARSPPCRCCVRCGDGC